jgi:two-component system copper resistance phosphate regulon response regulator CusR
MQFKILLVEDDARLGKTIKTELESNDFAVEHAFDGNIAMRLFLQENFDIVLLDINIPLINGFELCKIFRQKNPDIPIIMLTALGELDDKMLAFSGGADDYLVKPFNIKELIARIKVFIKRRSMNESQAETITVGDLSINILEKQVTRAGIPINLTAKEFKLLELLARNEGKVFSKPELAEKVWEQQYATNSNTIEVYINFLRNKIDKPFEEKMIHTKSGFGYYLKQP